MKRRSFFQSCIKAAAIIALAPQIAFRVRDLTFEPVSFADMYTTVSMEFFRGPRFTLYDFILDQQGKPNAYRAYLDEKAPRRTKNNLNKSVD